MSKFTLRGAERYVVQNVTWCSTLRGADVTWCSTLRGAERYVVQYVTLTGYCSVTVADVTTANSMSNLIRVTAECCQSGL